MPKVKANGITMTYDQQGTGKPLILIPFLTADHACYAFQVAEYAKHFTCISVDPRGTGETDKPDGTYSTELFADDVAAFMQALGVDRAHVAGLSLGAATGMWLAAKYPEKVRLLSLHSSWTKTDLFIKTVVEGWQVMAKSLGSVAEMVILGIFPWCFTPELYSAKPDYVQSLAAFVRGRPPQPVDAFLLQSDAVIAHDIEAQLSKIDAPTLITFGRFDMITSTRFADQMKTAIQGAELVVFDGCAHVPLYEKVEEFNQKTLEFLKRHSAQMRCTAFGIGHSMDPLDLVGLRPLMARGEGRSEIVIGMIDGPVAVTHPDLSGARIREVPGPAGSTCSRADSVACTHATFVAGILVAKRGSQAAAICPGCTLLIRPIFAETTNGSHQMPSAEPGELAAAIIDSVGAGARVINLSAAPAHPSAQRERTLEEALDYAFHRSVMVVAAAGN